MSISTGLLHAWVDFVRMLVTTDKPHSHHGLRKIVHGIDWEVPGEIWRTGIKVPFSKLGYKNNTSKLKQLARNYHNVEAIRAANEKLSSRIERGSSQTSVGIALGAGAKSSKSMGFCMQSVVVSHTKDDIRIDMFYRSTEAIQKFIADLKFLHELIIPQLLYGIKDGQQMISSVKFHFSNAYVSAMFFPLIYQFVYPPGFLDEILKVDPKWWRTASIDLYRMLRKDTRHSFRLHQVMWEFFQTLGLDHRGIERYLKLHEIYGKQFALTKKSTETEENDED